MALCAISFNRVHSLCFDEILRSSVLQVVRAGGGRWVRAPSSDGLMLLSRSKTISPGMATRGLRPISKDHLEAPTLCRRETEGVAAGLLRRQMSCGEIQNWHSTQLVRKRHGENDQPGSPLRRWRSWRRGRGRSIWADMRPRMLSMLNMRKTTTLRRGQSRTSVCECNLTCVTCQVMVMTNSSIGCFKAFDVS